MGNRLGSRPSPSSIVGFNLIHASFWSTPEPCWGQSQYSTVLGTKKSSGWYWSGSLRKTARWPISRLASSNERPASTDCWVHGWREPCSPRSHIFKMKWLLQYSGYLLSSSKPTDLHIHKRKWDTSSIDAILLSVCGCTLPCLHTLSLPIVGRRSAGLLMLARQHSF